MCIARSSAVRMSFIQVSTPKLTAGLFVFLLTNALRLGDSVPTSHPRQCSSKEPLVYSHGDKIELECESICSNAAADDSTVDFKWMKKVIVGGSPIDLGITTGPLFTLEEALFRDGGMYSCWCADNGNECSYNVSVIPKMVFEASETHIHEGDTFELTCTMTGFPTNFTRVLALETGEPLPNPIKKTIDVSTTRTYVPVFQPVGEVYVCEGESYFSGQLVACLRQEVTVVVYNPPSIIYTTEYIISSEKDYGATAKLTCTVQTSADTNSYVTWFTKGNEINNSSKFTMTAIVMEDKEIVKYQLTVSDIQETDIGSYLCRLSSSYGIEDMQEAWIQVDFRKNPEAIGESGKTHAHGTEGGNYAGPTAGQNNILFFAFCGLLVIIAMFALWRISQGHRSPYKATPLLKYHSQEATSIDIGIKTRKQCRNTN